MDIRKRKGFTLIEVMMAVGISSFLLLIVQQLMTKTFRTSRSAEQKSQIREIAVSSMLMLEKIESCNETLVGLDVSGSDVPGIKNSRGGVMYAVAPNGIIGTGASRIEIESIRIDGYENIAAPYFNGEDQATVTMTFKRGSAIGVDLSTLTQEELGKLRTRESGGRLVEVHRFSVNVSTIPSSTIIDSCKYSLFESSGNELSSACTMIGGSEVSGRCRDIQVESIDATARNGAANIGAALYVDGDVTAITSGNISTGATDYRTDLVADNYVRTDQLVTRPTVSPGTTSGYSVVLDSIMTTSLGGGSKTYPSSGILDTSGTLLVGTSSSDYIPTGLGGIAVANDLILPSGSRLYVNALSDSYATTSENDRIVITADWAANKIADAMTDGSGSHPSITSIKDSILAGGELKS
jgi:prepilin-type N-terminal cleavage/methylation domain-containing protein